MRTAVVTPHKVLAVATALVGAISIVSALTPDLASRSEVIRGALPEGAMQFAGAITIAFGVALLWLSLALARRKRRAWQLALVLMAGTAVSHLVKGLDVEEATASLVVLAGLLAYRRSFTVRGCPHSVRPLLFEVVAVGALVGALSADAAGLISLPEKIGDAFAILIGILLFGALYLWFRPIAAQLQEGAIARAAAERIVGETGCDTLCFFALRGDKRYFFSPSGRTFLAYRVVNGVALVSGDPIGDEAESGELVAEFRRIAQARGWRMAILASREGLLPVYQSMGLKPVYLGDEAVVVPRNFSLEGRPIRKVRQSVTRLEKAGYRARVLEVREIGPALAEELLAVSAEWRGRWPERGFTMAMDRLFAYPEALIAVAERADGHVGGFIHLVPVPATGGLSLASMRRREEVPNGLMEFLLARTIEWARERDVPEFSLNFSVFAQLILEPELPLALGPPLRDPQARPPLPDRPLAALQPEILPGVAAALRLPREQARLPARRARVPPRRIAAGPAGAVGARSGPRRSLSDDAVSVRYMVDDVDAAIEFLHDAIRLRRPGRTLAGLCGGDAGQAPAPAVGPESSAGRPMPDGHNPGPGGWNRIHFVVDDIAAEVERLRAAASFSATRSSRGPGGRQIVLEDPAGQPDRAVRAPLALLLLLALALPAPRASQRSSPWPARRTR